MEYMKEHGSVDGTNLRQVCNKAARFYLALEETQSSSGRLATLIAFD